MKSQIAVCQVLWILGICSPFAWGAAPSNGGGNLSVGTAEVVSSTPDVAPGATSVRVSKEKSERVINGKGDVFPGESIHTTALQTVILKLKDQSLIVIGPSTDFTVRSLSVKSPQNRVPGADVGVFTGQAFIKVPKGIYGGKSKFVVRTRTAVMGVRGTEFLVEESAAGCSLHTLDGTVALAKKVADLGNADVARMVKAGRESTMGPTDERASAPKHFDVAVLLDRLSKVSPSMAREVKSSAEALRSGKTSAAKGSSDSSDGKDTTDDDKSGSKGSSSTSTPPRRQKKHE